MERLEIQITNWLCTVLGGLVIYIAGLTKDNWECP